MFYIFQIGLFIISNLLGKSFISNICSIVLNFTFECSGSFISISIVPISHWDVLWSRSNFSASSGVTFSATWLACNSKSITASWEVHLHKSLSLSSGIFPSLHTSCVWCDGTCACWVGRLQSFIVLPPKIWAIWGWPSYVGVIILLH